VVYDPGPRAKACFRTNIARVHDLPLQMIEAIRDGTFILALQFETEPPASDPNEESNSLSLKTCPEKPLHLPRQYQGAAFVVLLLMGKIRKGCDCNQTQLNQPETLMNLGLGRNAIVVNVTGFSGSRFTLSKFRPVPSRP
jgi:hypothetical protein